MKNITIYLSLFLFFACKETEIVKPILKPSKIQIAYKQVDSLFNVFKEEALARNQKINTTTTRIIFNNVITEGYWGYSYDDHIALDSTIWYELSTPEREWLLFHELGHNVLKRGHQNRTFANSEFYSIMLAGEATGFGSIYFYSFRRKYYIDELFDVLTPIPDWINNLPDYETIKTENKQVIIKETFDNNNNNWQLGDSIIKNGQLELKTDWNINSPIQVNTNVDFEIEFDIKLSTLKNQIFFAFGDKDNRLFLVISPENQKNLITLPYLPNMTTKLNAKLTKTAYKLTLRKIKDRYYYYLDENLVYMFDIFNIKTEKPLWFFAPQDDILFVDNLTYFIIK